MKAIPLIFENGEFVQCESQKVTNIKLHLPGPSGILILPVMIHGTREGTGRWTWNGNTGKPTLRPSILTQCGHFAPGFKADEFCWCKYYKEHPDETSGFKCYRCHTWVNDGRVQFLPDCSHELAGQTLDLLEV